MVLCEMGGRHKEIDGRGFVVQEVRIVLGREIWGFGLGN